MNLTVIPLKSKYQKATFVLFDEITKIFFDNNVSLKNGDIIVISSKYVAGSQGRILETNSVVPSDRANLISKKFKIKLKFAEIILRESDEIFGGVSGFSWNRRPIHPCPLFVL